MRLADEQLPRLLHLPPDVASSGATEAIDFAERACGISLDPWQRWCVYWALAERTDGSPAAFEVAIVCPRQNGKNYILEVIQLASLYLAEDETLVHSAHKFDTSVEHFNRLKFLFESTPELSVLLLPGDRSFVTSNGKEHIRLNTGQRILFKARHRGGGRGFTGDKVFLDEAYDLPAAAIGNMIPTMSTRPGAQVFYTSSAPHATSSVLHAVRQRGAAADPSDRLFYAEWGTDEDAGEHITTTDEMMAAIRVANPAVIAGRISEGYILQEIRTFSGDPDLVDEHRRERLGIASAPIGSADAVIPLDLWDSLEDAGSLIAGRTLVALDVSPDRKWATFAAAGRRGDGLVHVEEIHRQPGTSWVIPYALDRQYLRESGLRIEKGGPAASLIGPLREAGIVVDEVATSDLTRATGQFIDLALAGQIRHMGQQSMRSAVAAAKLRASGDAELWSRRSSKMDITPLVAATIALGGVPDAAPPPRSKTIHTRSSGRTAR